MGAESKASIRVPCPYLRASYSFGLFVGVVAVRSLHFLDKGDVFLLGLLHCDSLVDDLLPGILLGFPLHNVSYIRTVPKHGLQGGRARTFRSNMPGAGALAISSPVATLYKAVAR